MTPNHFDVIIIGAGISGISAAYHLQDKSPNKSYTILEGRESLGGTWDLFRYPGIRSDSDMYSFGFSFRPWTGDKVIASGENILQYLKDTASEFNIDKNIRYNQKVNQVSWSSEQAKWTVSSQSSTFTCNFILMCAGYYNYEEGYTPDFEGIENYTGQVIHPQKWTPDIDYKNKKVTVIGSGATAVTLVPVLAEQAAHVTMLQRSPTYIVSRPDNNLIDNILSAIFPKKLAHQLMRRKYVFLQQFNYKLARRYPDVVKKAMLKAAQKELGENYDIKTHFTPSYNPWDQRICLIPNGDLFQSIREKKSTVVTDHIDKFTEKGILLKSGQELESDIVVTATGLKLQLLSHIKMVIDNEPLDIPSKVIYKGVMLNDLPNLVFVMGYTNASWTLKSELVGQYASRLLNHMDKNNFKQCVPKQTDDSLELLSSVDFNSGYFNRAIHTLPKQGNKGAWRFIQDYFFDKKRLMKETIADDEMKFS